MYTFFHCHYAFQKFPFFCVTLCVLHALQNATLSLLNLSREGTFVETTGMEKWLAWTQNALHGKHAHALTQPHIDSIASNTWLTWGELFPETEGLGVPSRTRCLKLKITENTL